MARPLRIEFEGALYHVMARGNAWVEIFVDDADRQLFLDNLGGVCGRYGWCIWAWCLMSNHYHLLIETLEPTLSKGMREVNGVYTQAFNRRHGRSGHVLQGRFKSPLVEKDNYLLELSRYVVLNPARAGMVETAANCSWRRDLSGICQRRLQRNRYRPVFRCSRQDSESDCQEPRCKTKELTLRA
jgi:putative transposase